MFCGNSSLILRCFSVTLERNIHISFKIHKKSPENLKGKKLSSQLWLRRQLNDPYVQKSRVENWRCRSAFKLLEIDDKRGILKPGNIVIDCGAAPGSWSQVAVKRVNTSDPDQHTGTVIGIDIQHMFPVPGATILDQHDFTKQETQLKLTELLCGKQADVILSDMAPNASGSRELDHDQIVQLCMSVLEFSPRVLRPGGTVLCKLWMGRDTQTLHSVMERMFSRVKVVKPDASRSDSAEIFLLGTDFVGIKKT
ncbi:hypothetical protein CHS0354_009673 [Potamilus streckersoni]|uniref:rRNA methyltransferase 2, mitochondrial n=1 Tax=Potamilus streckersoni TaxID=2493646 RepID=A0AAE0SLX5_9BIVA|nr:hypothetical protein CHS0354_009673 [Potamilus streckersoni]